MVKSNKHEAQLKTEKLREILTTPKQMPIIKGTTK
jgi:hypothetical protein